MSQYLKIQKQKNKQKDMAFFSIKKKSLVLCMLACGLSANAQIQDSLKPNLLNRRKTM
jgi:hypothetical protein